MAIINAPLSPGYFTYGTNDSDIINGSAIGDFIFASGGNDTLYGNEGGDVLYGGVGNDISYGGAGNDFLFGEEGNDTLYGNEGNDALNGGADGDTLDGGVGADTVVGGTGNDTFYVDSPNDVVVEAANEGIDTMFISTPGGFPLLPDNVENFTLLNGSTPSAGGNALDNMIIGNDADNALFGYYGNDVLIGGNGNDVLLGGNDNDFLSGGPGSNILIGGLGADKFEVGIYQVNGLDKIQDFSYLEGDKINITTDCSGTVIPFSYFTYEQSSGKLLYDNPSDGLPQSLLVTLQANLGIGFIPSLDIEVSSTIC
jgi:Ca2+-binding RTX toxin-like protein